MATTTSSSSPAKTATRVGDYEVLVGGAVVAFWPLDPEVNISKTRPAIVAAPTTAGKANTVVVPVFGVFDIMIRTTEGAVTEMIAPPVLANAPGGKATLKKMPLVRKSDDIIHIRFAVDHSKIAQGGSWEGALRLTGKSNAGKPPPTSSKTEMKLKVARAGTVNDLFVFFVAHARPKKNAWIKSRVVTNSGAAVGGADVDLKVLRDNGGYEHVNRRIPLATAGGDLFGFQGRPVLAVPVAWPLIFTLTKASHVTRGHMINIKDAEAARDNLSPLVVGPMRMTPTAAAKLTNRKFLFDAGHGIVYAFAKARRSQEWYVAHKLADRVAAILQSEHDVKPGNISWSRSAGFGLIEPGQVRTGGSPESGEKRFQLDLPAKKVAIKQAALGLHDLAALLLTKHGGDKDAAVAVTDAEHAAFLTRNQTTITAIVTRLNTKLSATQERVAAGSPHWDGPTKRYVYKKEKKDASGTWKLETTAPPVFPITTTDWFALDSAALQVLADRSARWSLFAEIGGDATFRKAARDAMLAEGALDYFRDKIVRYMSVPAPHPYLNYGSKAWSPGDRNKFLNSAGGSADMILTLHENAGGGKGGMALVSDRAGADAPPADQIRIGKIFVKYLDPFDHGVRQGGVAKALASNPAELLFHGNTMRSKYVYFETEFMDGKDPDDPSKFAYEAMVTSAFIERVARQMVCGIVEWLLDPQPDLDPVKYPLGANIGGLW